MKHLELYIDGASKGNPGPAGVGIIICAHGEVVKNIAKAIGKTTNNVAEYTALICGLQEALNLKAETLVVNTDSQLLHRQMSGAYKVRHPNILPLYYQARALSAGFRGVAFNHIPRESNRGADKLANRALKEAKER